MTNETSPIEMPVRPGRPDATMIEGIRCREWACRVRMSGIDDGCAMICAGSARNPGDMSASGWRHHRS